MTGGYREFYDRMQAIAMGDAEPGGRPISVPLRREGSRFYVNDAADNSVAYRSCDYAEPAMRAAIPKVLYASCRTIRQGDENYCSTCSKRWDVGEPKPECGR